MTPTLDRNRDYGTVHGDHELGATYSQDGFLFDTAGTLIEGALDPDARARLERLQKQGDAIAEAKAKFRELMPDMSEEQIDKVINAENLRPKDDNAALTPEDLAEWAAGKKSIIFGKVTKRIRELYNISPANRLQCLEILAENGVIPAMSGTPTSPSL